MGVLDKLKTLFSVRSDGASRTVEFSTIVTRDRKRKRAHRARLSNEIELDFLDPPINDEVWYHYSESSNKIYEVDLASLTCSCPNFQKGRGEYGAYDVRRYCKHLLLYSRAISSCTKPSLQHELVYFSMGGNKSYPIHARVFLLPVDENDVLIVDDRYSEWANIFTKRRLHSDQRKCTGEIRRYGFNFEEWRWAYGEAPFQPKKIKAFLKTLPRSEQREYPAINSGVEYSLQRFVQLPTRKYLSRSLVSQVLEEIDRSSQVDPIKSALCIMGEAENRDAKLLASYWLKKGKQIAHHNQEAATDFLERASALDPDCGAEKLTSIDK